MSSTSVEGGAPEVAPEEAWSDGKRHLWLLGLLVPSLPFLGGGLSEATGSGVFWFLGPILIFVVIPAIDLVVGIDRTNPPEDMIEELEKDKYYRWITYVYLSIQYVALVWACWMWTAGDLLSLIHI